MIHGKCLPCEIYLKLPRNYVSVVVSTYTCKYTQLSPSIQSRLFLMDSEFTNIDGGGAMQTGHSNKKPRSCQVWFSSTDIE